MSVGHEGIVFFSTRYFKCKHFPQIFKWKQNKTFWTLLADKVVCRIFWIIGTDNSLVNFPTKSVSSEGFLFVCFAFNATASECWILLFLPMQIWELATRFHTGFHYCSLKFTYGTTSWTEASKNGTGCVWKE